MKKIAILLASLLMLMSLAACGGSEDKPTETAAPAGQQESGEAFAVKLNSVEVKMNMPAADVLSALGDPIEYFESESCAFQGLDKIYTYSSFQIYTYPKDDVDYIQSVILLDDSCGTEEGIWIGNAEEALTDTYGESEDTSVASFYVYTKGDAKLSFICENGKVTGITYEAITD